MKGKNKIKLEVHERKSLACTARSAVAKGPESTHTTPEDGTHSKLAHGTFFALPFPEQPWSKKEKVADDSCHTDR